MGWCLRSWLGFLLDRADLSLLMHWLAWYIHAGVCPRTTHISRIAADVVFILKDKCYQFNDSSFMFMAFCGQAIARATASDALVDLDQNAGLMVRLKASHTHWLSRQGW
jgi:hypothetical protein